MFRRRLFGSMLAVGGMVLATQQAGAVVVIQNNDLTSINPVTLDELTHFEGGTGYIYQATATSDSNLFAAIGVQNDIGYAGFAQYSDAAFFYASLGQGALQAGNVLRVSAWVMSNPDNPFSNPAAGNQEDGFRFEFLDTPLGAGGPGGANVIFNTPLSPVGQAPLLTTGWTQKSFTYTINSTDIPNPALIQEVRPVLVQAGGTGATGEMFVDNFMVEVFANAGAVTPLGGSAPGDWVFPPPPPVLYGDICCAGVGGNEPDGFVGIGDLNVVLGGWNTTPPPPSLSPVLLSNFSGFALSGTYVGFDTGTFIDNGTDWTLQANDFGGGWFDLPAPIDATGRTALELKLDVNIGNVSDKFNIVLIDGDGTERVYRFLEPVIGDDQTLTIDLDDFLQDNAAGTVPGLDLSTITTFHIQGTFANGNPGQLLDLTLDNLALIEDVPDLYGDINNDDFIGIADLNTILGEWNLGTPPSGGAAIPEPASLSLLALGGLSMLRRRSA